MKCRIGGMESDAQGVLELATPVEVRGTLGRPPPALADRARHPHLADKVVEVDAHGRVLVVVFVVARVPMS
jgi:hypothetical protein